MSDDRLVRIRTAMAKLVVRQSDDEGDDFLVVDAVGLLRDDNDVRYWVLYPEDDGTWSHFPSGEVEHPLSDHLWSIASVYLERVVRDRLNSKGGDATRRALVLSGALIAAGYDSPAVMGSAVGDDALVVIIGDARHVIQGEMVDDPPVLRAWVLSLGEHTGTSTTSASD